MMRGNGAPPTHPLDSGSPDDNGNRNSLWIKDLQKIHPLINGLVSGSVDVKSQFLTSKRLVPGRPLSKTDDLLAGWDEVAISRGRLEGP
jgi:hypothetical protein